MKNFETLDHPADIGIKVYGKNLEELFINSAIGSFSLITDTNKLSLNLKKEINLTGNNIEDLFTKWLDEIIYLFDCEGFLIKNVHVSTLQERSINAIFEGEKFDPNKHEIELYLKAVTYHQLEIKETKNGWEAIVFFDV